MIFKIGDEVIVFQLDEQEFYEDYLLNKTGKILEVGNERHRRWVLLDSLVGVYNGTNLYVKHGNLRYVTKLDKILK